MNHLRKSRNAAGIAIPLLLTVVSSALFVLSFPPQRLRLLAWIALVPLLLALRSGSLRRTLALACLWGMLAAYGVTDWLPPAIANYYHQPWWLGMALFLTAAFLMGAADYMAFAGFYWWGVRRGLRPMTLLAAAAWVCAELGRARILSGNPWGLVGYSQAGSGLGESPSLLSAIHFASLELAQIADLTGVYGISFVVVAVNVLLAECWIRTRRPAQGRPLGAELLSCGLLLLAALSYGKFRLAPAEATTPIAIVQGNLDLGSRWSSDLYGRNLDVYLEWTAKSASSPSPRIVFWPENAMTFFVDDEPLYRSAIGRTMRRVGAQLVAGAPRYERYERSARHESNEDSQDEQATKYFNSAFVLAPDGQILGHYDKRHLLPFAEYFPFGAVEFMKRSFGRVREFSRGLPTRPLPTRAGPAGVVICNEAMFPRIARQRVKEGAAFLVNLANDSWIPSREFAEHQFDMVSMRAIELRRYLVRASTSGPSGIVDPAGRILARSQPFSRDVVRGSIAPHFGRTVYACVGDLFAWLCLLAVVGCLLGGWYRKKRAS